jgi:hypothetical protein
MWDNSSLELWILHRHLGNSLACDMNKTPARVFINFVSVASDALALTEAPGKQGIHLDTAEFIEPENEHTAEKQEAPEDHDP